MIDIRIIRENPEKVQQNNASRNVSVDVDAILKLDAARRELQATYDEQRKQQKALSKGAPKEKDFATLKALKGELKEIEQKQSGTESELRALLEQLPNINHPDTPIGSGEDDNVEVRVVGEARAPEHARGHEEIGERLGLFDLERGAKVAGSRFWYLKGMAVHLEVALVAYALNKLTEKGFTPMMVPHLVREEVLYGAGFLPAAQFEIYHVNPDDDDLYLIGTSEAPLVGYYKDEVINVDAPIRLVAFSPCYRREAGAYGKDITGIFRGHQFDKIEMVSFTKPEESNAEHDYLLGIEEEIVRDLGIPYRVMLLCSGDMSSQAAKCYDIEAWLPGQGRYREITSCSNTTDYQARRLDIKYQTTDGLAHVHTLNGTALAVGRMMIAILENHLRPDGTVAIPKPLQPYMGVDLIA